MDQRSLEATFQQDLSFAFCKVTSGFHPSFSFSQLTMKMATYTDQKTKISLAFQRLFQCQLRASDFVRDEGMFVARCCSVPWPPLPPTLGARKESNVMLDIVSTFLVRLSRSLCLEPKYRALIDCQEMWTVSCLNIGIGSLETALSIVLYEVCSGE